MSTLKIYRIKIPSQGIELESFYDIPVREDIDRKERTIGLGSEYPKYKKYLRNMHTDWQDALVLPIRQNNSSLRPPDKGEILRVIGHGGITEIGIINEIIYPIY